MRSGGSTATEATPAAPGVGGAAPCAGASAVIRSVTTTHSPQSAPLHRIGEAEHGLGEGLRLVEVRQMTSTPDDLDARLGAGPQEGSGADAELVELAVEQQHRTLHPLQ